VAKLLGRLPLPAAVARGEAGFAAEELCEVAGIRVADVELNVHDVLLRFPEQAYCLDGSGLVRRQLGFGVDDYVALRSPMRARRYNAAPMAPINSASTMKMPLPSPRLRMSPNTQIANRM
jgi:hypothetical protein